MEYKKRLLKRIINRKNIIVFAISFLLFFGITILFNKAIPVYEISTVRPSGTLNPVLGLAYGWPAAIGCTLGNFVSDLVSGYGINVALMGLLPQLIYGILPYYIWKLFAKSISMRTRLDSPLKVVVYVALMAVNAIPIGAAVGLIQLYSDSTINFIEVAGFAALNDFGVCLAFGLPLMVLLDHIYSRFLHKGRRKLSDNEKIILFSSLLQLVIFGINILIVYLVKHGDTNLAIWKDIYLVTIITTSSVLAISIIVMQIRHTLVKKQAGLQIITKKHGTIYLDTKKKIEFVSFPGDVFENRVKAKFITKKTNSEISYEKGWYTSLSTQRGCLMNCAFCDCPSFGFHGNVSKEDLEYQLKTIIDTHYVTQTKYFEIDFTRMGEPSFNNEILEFIEYDLRKLINKNIDAERIVPSISTMLPRNKILVERFILDYCRIKNEVYNGDALLQFSIHSTDNKSRDILLDKRSLPLEDIAEIGKKMPLPIGYKYCLSFAVGKESTIDANTIDKLFSKDKFLIKLTPIHSTYNAIDRGFDTMNCDEQSLINHLESEFVSLGWNVIICDDNYGEDEDDLTCGKLLLPNVCNDSSKNKNAKTRYGIIAALKYEEDLFRAHLSNVTKITLLNKPAYTGFLGDNEIIIMQCGMGKVSAGICAQAMIDNYHPDYIINTGCAGALNPDLKVGDVVVSRSVVEWDLDLRQIGLPLGYIDALGCVEMKASKFLIDKIMNTKPKNVVVKQGVIASGDQFVSKEEQRKHIIENFPMALCVEMEGAAIGHVCLQNDIPFCIIRSMSDTADGSSGTDFEKFSADASKISAAWLIEMLKKY